MLNKLSEKFQLIFSKIKEKGKISENDIKQSLKEIKLALLEADVHYKVVKDFIKKLEEQANQEALSNSLTPGQQMIKITHKALTEILGEKQTKINFADRTPTTILLIGLQGSGKTTTAAKLALNFKNSGYIPLLVAADKIRPAAQEQLTIMAKKAGVEVFTGNIGENALNVVIEANKWAKEHNFDIIIIDSAGRLHIDQQLILELKNIKKAVNVKETLLILDSLMGQDALRVASNFNNEVGVDGFVLTKLEGDARGGVALSIKSLTNLPIKFIGIGEKITDLEPFYPERISSRILGMGDTLTLIEKIEANYAQNELLNIGKKEFREQFNLNDFYEQFKRIKKMGSLETIFSMMPFQFSGSLKNIKNNFANEEKGFSRVEAIICSMTMRERQDPDILNGSRKRRIAKGSGTNVSDVNRLLNQFYKMKKILRHRGGLSSFMPFVKR